MMQMFGEYAEEFGPEAVEKGVELAIRGRLKMDPDERKYFPSPDEFEQAIRKAKFTPTIQPAKKGCPFCDSTGWKEIAPRTVVVCDCRLVRNREGD